MERISTNAISKTVARSDLSNGSSAPPRKKNGSPPRRAHAPLLPLADRSLTAISKPNETLGSRLAPVPQRAVHASAVPSAAGNWNPLSRLKPEELAGIPETVVEKLGKDLHDLYEDVQSKGLNYVPVFGYLSLRYKNFHELGKRSQDEVREGKDWVPASLDNHALDFVMSTQYRGHHQHPGVVAGLSQSEGSAMDGVILKLPVGNAEELLARVIRRELLDENDLIHPVPATPPAGTAGLASSADAGPARPPSPKKPHSNLMYSSAVRPVTLPDGAKVKALVFVTNPDSAKSLASVFKDREGVSPQRLAYLMTSASKGDLGGPAIDYWKRFVESCETAKTAVSPIVSQAIRLASDWPDAFTGEPAAPDDMPRQHQEAAWFRAMTGAAAPRRVWHERKPEPSPDGASAGGTLGTQPKPD
ncbi:gamma-glutamylcyclotransferase [Ralstonia pseudosolanacearum]|uniref:gamma-glutamylcyclotransferase n=1 Tax=Ralstonia pseudosolanacearum TaxID=1310165 RepID=UPI00073D5CAD|nr:gamma-glutamylcyclotransferase [Ralstonia pseudosolanacearum]KAF3458159.1 RipAY-effector family protein [Ralstonia solanacearum]API77539.1 type III effector protein [Ralstonia pseudosolanacearum]MDK1381667.1 gamma-glutamylcyclotransferase [Ralstonia pseudosolanacearum]NKA11315.1 RipAY-effector family protein [Ralstonia solanacearum]NKA80881.1 RipAY-effector family protein [Ralstonia solanacearum]